ncbi:protein-methionine-sulfoxide reductase heme-binding subunit MsrQ, partial [Pontitalea aquivivens]|uniref:protein-methionine-sulfoxide reductase heme-binding subunit MsrQ n=1 Tax=Pontitalea aquivivens TaxID=3388663 RepID=UPI003970B45F
MRAARFNDALRQLPPFVVYMAGLLPLVWIVWLGVVGDLGVDPVKEIEHRLGKIALWLLAGGLVVTPLRRFVGVNLVRFRRALGLLAFFYVVLHLAAWAILDMGMLWAQVAADLVKRSYLVLGFGGFVLLVPLAMTSNDRAVRWLRGNWRRLHWLVYPAALLGVAHYLWQMKVVTLEGWLWLGTILVLLATRLRPLRWFFGNRCGAS